MNEVNGRCYLSLLDMSENPFHAQGVGLSAEYQAHVIAAYRYRNGHDRTTWESLPELVKKAVRQWAMPEEGELR